MLSPSALAATTLTSYTSSGAIHTLPMWSTAVGLCVTSEAAAALGYSRNKVQHIGQRLVMHGPMPLSGEPRVNGRLIGLQVKGSAAIVRIDAESDRFTAEYVMWVPGLGDRVREQGEVAGRMAFDDLTNPTEVLVPVRSDAAVLYRLTGDDHPVHVDPRVARDAGHPCPIIHGLCLLGMSVLAAVKHHGIAANRVTGLSAIWNNPAFPGEDLRVLTGYPQSGLRFVASQRGDTVCHGLVTIGSDQATA